ITSFIDFINENSDLGFSSFQELLNWSITKPEQFYAKFWEFAGIRSKHKGSKILIDSKKMPGATWFPGTKINFAENILRLRDNTPAIIFFSEDESIREISWNDLYSLVSKFSQALIQDGIKPGDRVVGFMPNIPEAVVAMLGVASIGAVWSSCSPDFGVEGTIDRFGQIEPKALITANGYMYNGKEFDSLEVIENVLSKINSIKRVIVVPFIKSNSKINFNDKAIDFNQYLLPYREKSIDFYYSDFNDPLYIMYSSGTTGKPKCIVHSIGGTLLQHMKEHVLHTDIKVGDRIFYFTTCGWMMWNWLVSALSCGSTIILYDGSPFFPDHENFWSAAERLKINVFGASAKYFDSCNKHKLIINKKYDLKELKAILSTGSPLAPTSFDFIYKNIKKDVRLSSISGGTDIISCFASGVSVLPVRRGEIQTIALGMNVKVYDEEGKSVVGKKGELVCESPFPSMPISFWNDLDGKKYFNSYFRNFKNVWTHGDYCEINEYGGMVIYGRSDTVLNPGGVRIGTAEIYRVVESMQEIDEAICVSQDWNSDVRIILFVKVNSKYEFNEKLKEKISKNIKTFASPRHVPAKIIKVADIPRTISGKISEIAVRNIIHGKEVKNKDALANPDILNIYKNIIELKS
ncbi:acetoacetate--CoA ligase, partial [Alphaproteobacteria bacterium]|nr:acetoacetate--CoA ligase [Alphaproteobacteria bacterium]